MPPDLVITAARIDGHADPVDIVVAAGRVVDLGPGRAASLPADAPRHDAAGAFAFPGFVDSHIHLDKADLLDRCVLRDGTLAEAVALTARAKANFTVADIAERATRVLRQALVHGTTRLRSFVEVDPRVGLRGLEALVAVRRAHADAVAIDLCAFAQEGTTQEPATLALLEAALAAGADSLGGCPYTDAAPSDHITALFDLAEKHAVALDFHVDFDLDATGAVLPEIIRETRRRGYGGRVSVGHATKLSALPPDAVDRLADALAEAGVAVTGLPATDLFLLGRDRPTLTPRGLAPLARLAARGVTVSVATNNVLNPFTPYGDASLCRMANLYANVAHLAGDADLDHAFAAVTRDAARLLGAPYGLAVGATADIVLIDAPSAAAAVRAIAPVLAGWKGGRLSFERPRPILHRPV